jgi:hypothetical protein
VKLHVSGIGYVPAMPKFKDFRAQLALTKVFVLEERKRLSIETSEALELDDTE